MAQPNRPEKLAKLTKRQRQILALRCQGKTLAQIADVIQREERTVKDHMGNIYEKLGLDGVRGTARDFELAEFCRVLRDSPAIEPPTRDEPEPEPPEPPQRALVAVMEDELALMRPHPAAVVHIPGSGTVRPFEPSRPRFRAFVLLFTTALGASLISAVIVAAVVFRLRSPETVVERQVLVPVTVVAAAPPPAAPSAPPGPTSGASPAPAAPSSAVALGTHAPAGEVLYEENWSRGLENWSSSAQWKTVGGLLVNDGTKDLFATIGDGVAFAPYQPDRADYAVEAEIQIIRTPSDTDGSRFGIVARAAGNDGYQAGLGVVNNVASVWAGNLYQALAQRSYAPGTAFHTYRLEVRDNTIRYLIDGGLIVDAVNNRFLNPGRVGLWDSGAQINVRRFRVLGL